MSIMKRWLPYVVIAIVFFGIGFGVQHLLAKDKHQDINEAEAVGIVQSLYSGTIEQVVQTDRHYEMQLENDFGLYSIQMNRDNGAITALTLIDKHENNVNVDEERKETRRTKIGKERAAEIALSKVNGVVDDIDLESDDGSHVYKVEIETETEEAIVYVQAYTGEILSFTFESDDDDD